jgi:cation:H+ antiporter
MLLILSAAVVGLALLVWSAGRFVDGSSGVARRMGLSPLLIGMVVVGFGTSAPELTVSALAARDGLAGIAVGNAFGSNIANIALILGLTAMVRPITVRSGVLRRELPLLAGVTLVTAWLTLDGGISRLDSAVLLALFALVMGWTVAVSRRNPSDPLGLEMNRELANRDRSGVRDWMSVGIGLVLLVASSRLVVWASIELARRLGIGELAIGLTVVAVGTSLPELASSLVAAARGEDDLALGNIVGSNLFNTLAVIGVAAAIRPLTIDAGTITRDLPVMGALTASLFVFGYGFRGVGRINRVEGGILVAVYLSYTAGLLSGVI